MVYRHERAKRRRIIAVVSTVVVVALVGGGVWWLATHDFGNRVMPAASETTPAAVGGQGREPPGDAPSRSARTSARTVKQEYTKGRSRRPRRTRRRNGERPPPATTSARHTRSVT